MAWSGYGGGDFPEYVSVAARRARARTEAARLAKKQKRTLAPVGPLEGMKIVRTFWGKAWCQHLESYSDYASRLPRGRSYVRHGSVVDLQIAAGEISALVSGSRMYRTSVTIKPLQPLRWTEIASGCTGQIDSLVDLIRGNLSAAVMQVVTHRERGLFPSPQQISFNCSCPDWADMCKHVAAVLYGVGARLDDRPELLFTLRNVDHLDLVGKAAKGGTLMGAGRAAGATEKGTGKGKRKVIAGADLAAVFGIDLDTGVPAPAPKVVKARGRSKKKQDPTDPSP
jgi:uncharacterized Zn finger protein